MKVAFSTLGCRVNTYETEALIELFKKEGYQIVDFGEKADVYVINSCTVTNMGDKKSRQMVHRAHRINEDAIIAMVGCYSQIKPDEVSKIPGINIVLGTRNKKEIINQINKFKEERKNQVSLKDVLKDKVFEDIRVKNYDNRTRAFIKIQDGCNNFCSYCLIPYARGASVSKPLSGIIEEVKDLSKNGFKEIILSGIDVSSYGKDLEENITLVRVFEEIDKIDGIERIRIGSIGPEFFTDDHIKRLKALKKLCPHFHISLQSGCNETLKRMNRHYTAEEYSKAVNNLRENFSDISITTDIIVGFPGETEEEFNETYSFLQNIKLTKTHVFKYSVREGTRAAKLPDMVSASEKEERSKKLIELSDKLENEFINKNLGLSYDVLYEKRLDDGMYDGYTPNYIRVISNSAADIEDRILKTRLEKNINLAARGKIEGI
ncbi:MAG: tRNA (N(6)-L-threonylcarbamoyladenosine(37)-C(2))-methylthiotransferase MtaB [Bacillota bacterium]|nr:tRNA (N(6)-L-threonylcarbamoyladenosine(37)-C(2))-methylthiotransferase MtaB [Bacillota bacterium]